MKLAVLNDEGTLIQAALDLGVDELTPTDWTMLAPELLQAMEDATRLAIG